MMLVVGFLEEEKQFMAVGFLYNCEEEKFGNNGKAFFSRCECAGYIKLDESIERVKRENLDRVDEIRFSALLSMVTITGFI